MGGESSKELFDPTSLFTEGYLLGAESSKIPVSYDPPRHTSLVALPFVEGLDTRIRNCIHIDKIRELLTFLEGLDKQTLASLKIEGRVLNREQWEALQEDPLYRFYMYSRTDRGDARVKGHTTRVLVPSDLHISSERLKTLLETGYSPTGSQEQIGHKTGYYEAKFIVDLWNDEFVSPNSFTPLLGSVSEFNIGSDVLDRFALKGIANKLIQQFLVSERQVASTAVSVPLGTSSAFTPIQLSAKPSG